MKKMLSFSILLNIILLVSLAFVLKILRQKEPVVVPVSFGVRSLAHTTTVAVVPRPSGMAPFRWSQLESGEDYRVYIANLRSVGCPERTIEDIVRGDAARAFSWERSQLRLGGAGDGPWSRSQEMQLVASLLGMHPPTKDATGVQSAGDRIEGNIGDNEVVESTTPVQGVVNRRQGGGLGEFAKAFIPTTSAVSESPSYPLFLQNPDWAALGFNSEQQAVIAQVRQQFQNEISSLNQDPAGPATQVANTTATGVSASPPNNNELGNLTQWQKALQDADQQLSGLLGAQAYMAYEQQQYYAWYQPQVAAAAASGELLTINPAAFH